MDELVLDRMYRMYRSDELGLGPDGMYRMDRSNELA